MEAVDATKLTDYVGCLRYGYWKHEMGYIPIAPRLPLIFGSGIHGALAARYSGLPLTAQCAAFDEEWMAAQGAEDGKRNARNGAAIIVAYDAAYQTEPFTPDDILGVEIPFAIPIDNWFLLSGKLDLLYKYAFKPMIVDHKTASWMNDMFWQGMNPNIQFTNYIWGCNKVLGECAGLIVNAILVDASKRRFERRPTMRTPAELVQYEDEVKWLWEMVEMCRERKEWPKNPARCSMYGGCEYHMLCTTTGIDYRELVPSKMVYKVEKWDPIQHLRSKEKEKLNGGV